MEGVGHEKAYDSGGYSVADRDGSLWSGGRRVLGQQPLFDEGHAEHRRRTRQHDYPERRFAGLCKKFEPDKAYPGAALKLRGQLQLRCRRIHPFFA